MVHLARAAIGRFCACGDCMFLRVQRLAFINRTERRRLAFQILEAVDVAKDIVASLGAGAPLSAAAGEEGRKADKQHELAAHGLGPPTWAPGEALQTTKHSSYRVGLGGHSEITCATLGYS